MNQSREIYIMEYYVAFFSNEEDLYELIWNNQQLILFSEKKMQNVMYRSATFFKKEEDKEVCMYMYTCIYKRIFTKRNIRRINQKLMNKLETYETYYLWV